MSEAIHTERRAILVAIVAGALVSTVVSVDAVPARERASEGSIAFAEHTSGTIDTIEPDGSHRSVLIRSGYDPAWSPDGGRLVFVRSLRRTSELFVVRADGSHERRVTRTRALEGQPAWSPDGTHLAYVRSVGDPYSADIWIVSLRTGAVTRVTRTGYRNRSPSWSPDGGWIAFSSPHNTYGLEGTSDIYLKELRTGGLVRLTSHRGNDWAPAWSPDGGSIAFLSDRSGTSQVWLRAPEGGGPERLTSGAAAIDSFAWSPNGDQLVVSRHRRAQVCGLWTLDLMSGAAVPLTRGGCATDPSWRPSTGTQARV